MKRNEDETRGVYKIKTVGDEVELEQLDPFKDPKELKTIRLKFNVLVKNWTFYKRELAQRIDDDWTAQIAWSKPAIQKEIARGMLYKSMIECAAEQAVTPKDVLLCLQPSCLRSMRDLKKGELTLVPCAPASPAQRGDLQLECKVKYADTEFTFYINKQSQPSKAFAEWAAETTINPFFWVTPTSEKEEANMTFHTIKHGACSFQVLKNDRKVKAMTQLQFYKEATEAVALAGAEVVEDEGEGDDNPEVANPPPQKRLRRKMR